LFKVHSFTEKYGESVSRIMGKFCVERISCMDSGYGE
jgi:hypothetical protein